MVNFTIIKYLFCCTIVISVQLQHCHSLTLEELYPFGSQDETLKKEQDISSSEIALSVPIVHYQDTYGSIFVSKEYMKVRAITN